MNAESETGKAAGLRTAMPGWLEFVCAAALAFAYLYGYYRQTGWFLVAILLMFLTVSALLYVLIRSVVKAVLRRAPGGQAVKPLLYFGGLLLVGASPSLLPTADAMDQRQLIAALNAHRAEHGRYPEALEALPIARTPDSPFRTMADVRYQCDPAGASFTLSYRSKTVDWHYDSRTDRWRGAD